MYVIMDHGKPIGSGTELLASQRWGEARVPLGGRSTWRLVSGTEQRFQIMPNGRQVFSGMEIFRVPDVAEVVPTM